MKNLLKEYIKLIVQETINEQFFGLGERKPRSMFADYDPDRSGGGGGGGGYYDYDYTIGNNGDVDIMGVPSYDSNDGGLEEQDDGDSGGEDSGGDSDSGGDGDI